MARQVYGFLNDAIDEGGGVFIAEGELLSIEGLAPNDSVTLFAPAGDVSALSAIIPVRSDTEARRATPFAVEDDIATPVDEAHFAIGPVAEDLQTPRAVEVVSLGTMKDWSDRLAISDAFSSARLVALHAFLQDGEVFDIEGETAAHVHGRRFALASDTPADLKRAVFTDTVPLKISRPDFLKLISQRDDDTLPVINLRQGAFKARGHADYSGVKRWRLSAVLAACLMLAWAGQSLLEISFLEKQQAAAQKAIEDVYAQSFPDAPKPRNYIRAVSRATNGQASNGSVSFQDASAALYGVMQTVPQTQLLSLRYDQGDGALIATVAYAAYGDDAAVKGALVAAGYAAELGNARQESNGVVGDVIIRQGAS